MNRILVKIVGDEKFVPSYSSLFAAGADLKACINNDIMLSPGERALIDTGLKMEIPVGYEAQVRPRSGLAAKHGITVLNTPGTIDSDYRGEVKVILINLGDKEFTIKRGDRIAQIIFAPVTTAEFSLENALDVSERGTGGFGSTGV
ncbi:dUTP diphosphatase [Spirochaeta isovalerica]|uniref:Deoxyuridine 5'-triphosphate nucleotidohydrolase n=1 Tax=Spirochaeta isovalerica TaxID=150 RepID=A0A841R8K8_9SPIO|nr:dUTP diphosphatase [Spirochaeta isovalerica]MBB6478812.1 dUTP pyrophosphatase [Spirochaeta isovalerica]